MGGREARRESRGGDGNLGPEVWLGRGAIM